MDIIHENQYWRIGFDSAKSLMRYEWHPASKRMQIEEYKKEMQINAESCERYQPSKSLIDTREFLFTIPPDVQVWTDTEITPRFIKSGLRKLAFVVSSDIFAQVSLEQMLEEDNAMVNFQSRYFDSMIEAEGWLLET